MNIQAFCSFDSQRPYSSNNVQDQIQYFVEELPSDIHEDEDEINDEDENGNSPLVFAVLNGRLDLVRNLVDQGAFVNHQNYNGETALYWAAAQGSEQIVDVLIENGSNLNICNLDGASPAHVAAANGHCSILGKLIRNGAYVNSQDDVKDSVLHYAVREGRREIVEFLVRVCKAKVDIKNEDLESPLELAVCLEPSCMDDTYTMIVKTLTQASPSASSSSPFHGHGINEEKIKLQSGNSFNHFGLFGKARLRKLFTRSSFSSSRFYMDTYDFIWTFFLFDNLMMFFGQFPDWIVGSTHIFQPIPILGCVCCVLFC